MKLFSENSKASETADRVADMVILNFCFLAGCLPVVTIGTSVSAMYNVLGRRLRGEGAGVVAPFFQAWKENLKPACAAFLMQISVMGLLAFALGWVIGAFDAVPWFLGAVEWVLVVALIAVYLAGGLVYSQIARYELSLGACWKNGLLLMLANPIKTAANGVLLAAPALFCMAAPGLFMRLGFVWPLLGFSLIFHLSARLVRRILKPLEERSGSLNGNSDKTPA